MPNVSIAHHLAIALVAAALALAAGDRTSAAEVATPARIVSIGGATTEIVYELGLGERIVAVDTTSRYPAAAMEKPNVGYMRALAAEPILALDPDIVLVDADAGPPPVLAQLREAGLNLVSVPAEPTVAGVIEKIRVIAGAAGQEEKGRILIGRLQAKVRQVEASVSKAGRRPKVLFFLSVGKGSAPLTAGEKTSANGIIELAGGINAATGFEGYKPMTPEAVIAAAPDVLLITHRSLGLLGGPERLLAMPSVAATPAGRAKRVIAMDGLLLLGFGPRLGTAIGQLAGRLHPGLIPPSAAH